MTTPRFADLGRHGSGAGLRRAASAGAAPPEDAPEPDDEIDPDEKDKDMTDTNEQNAALKAAEDKGRAEAMARVNAVMASEHYAGREKLAAELLKSEMSADAIVAALAVSHPEPKASANDTDEAADREAMRQQLQAKNPDLGSEDGDKETAAAQAKADNYGWGKAYARATKPYGRKAAK